jgi:AcrR family transcriptional regulator
MRARTRILDAAMLVFRRHGFRRSSIEQAAEAAGLTRQALYHHFESREALFRAVIEQLHENALAAEIAAANATDKAGGSLADILVAEVTARLRQFIASFDGSPHIEELFSEHLVQAPTAGPCRKHDRPRLGPLHRDGHQRDQIRASGDAAGRGLPQGS